MSGQEEFSGPVSALLDAIGIEPDSYQHFVAWALAEQLVLVLMDAVEEDPDHHLEPLWNRADGGKRFRAILRRTTGRDWSVEDETRLFERVRLGLTEHDRKPIPAEDLLRLLWNTPHVCSKCGRRPPEIKLHVDHVFPASRGGSSNFENLQLLCAECNLRKSDKLEQGELWLSSV